MSKRTVSLLASLLAAALVLGACTSDDEGTPTAEKPDKHEPKIAVTPGDDAKDISPVQPVEVKVSDGELDSVTMTNPSGKDVKGELAADKKSWRSAEPLGYDRAYTVKAEASNKDGKATNESSFSTVKPAGTVYPSFFPPPGKTSTVGVGQPVVVIFDKPPADRKAAEQALKVTTTPAAEGAWFWWDDRTLHYRPRDYWKPGTTVKVDANIYGVDLGDGMYGDTDRTLNLRIGPAKVATIDDKTHKMLVTVNGKVVKNMPVSMGRPGSVTVKGKKITFTTPSGTYVAQEKYKVKRMDSGSYGLPSNASLGYDEKIPLAVRISNSGIFVHSAPWSVADQGRRNVSHGCVNLSPANGRWFYDNFHPGDIVTIKNTSAKLEPTDGFGDWNIPWEKWLEGSALK